MLCFTGDQSHPFAQTTINPLACCICWAGLLGGAVFPPWNEGPNSGSYSYMFAKQSYWYKLRGLLFKFKAILLVQTARAFFKLRRPRASQLSRGPFTGCTLIGRLQVTRWGRGIPPFHGKPKPKSWPPASPSPGSPTVGSQVVRYVYVFLRGSLCVFQVHTEYVLFL